MHMRRRPWRSTLPALGMAGMLALAACGSSGGGSGDDGDGDGQPERGGTLKMVGKGDVTTMDTAFAYYTLDYQLMRGFTRQLVSTPETDDPDDAGKIVPDMATEVPSEDNGGISDDGKTYTFTIKKGVKWNTDPARQVTAQDMKRGIKRLCNPNKPSGALSYYTSTIKGMSDFCDGLTDTDNNADAIADYINDNDISGIKTPEKRKVEFHLKHPTPDFLSIMTQYFATPAPKEYLKYKPSSGDFNQNVLSNGPYEVTKYKPNKKIVLERNKAWDADTDDQRAANVDKVVVDEGVEQQPAFQQVKVGDADFLWGTPPPTSELPSLYDDSKLELVENGSLNPYVVFNNVSENEDSALQDKEVRKAVGLAVNKKSIAQKYGGPKIAEPTCQLLPPTSEGHEDDYDCPMDAGKTGNPKKAKKLLADAGYGDGLTLKMKFRNEGVHPDVAQALKSSLKRAGIKLDIEPIPSDDFYESFLQVSSHAKDNDWDIALPGWVPDWYGLNGRTFLQPLFYSGDITKDSKDWGTNFGFYDNDDFNDLVDKAGKADSEDKAVKDYQKAAHNVVDNFGAVPVMFFKNAQLHSDRLKGFKDYPEYLGDITNVWLNQ